MTAPEVLRGPVFDHLLRLGHGPALLEHALLDEPRLEHGYCVDDVARVLVVAHREPAPDGDLRALARRSLEYCLSALAADGRCRNRMTTAGTWADAPGLGDWWGRALWGLGTTAVHAPDAADRAAALAGFHLAAQQRSPHPKAMLYAALGAGELLQVDPADGTARDLLLDVVATVPPGPSDARWAWPETRLTYGNATLPEVLLLAGALLPDAALLRRGLVLLRWLLDRETRDGHLSVTPVVGAGPGDRGPAFDQQPIEVAALADACARAAALTGDDGWLRGVDLAWAWFLGDNDSATPMVDLATGAGYDGLTHTGRNLNRGAESTLAALAVAQLARRRTPALAPA